MSTKLDPEFGEKFNHDFDLLDERADTLIGVLSRLSDHQESIKELIPVWRRPGWTTPAEFFLVESQLQLLARQAAVLDQGLARLTKGVGMVGR
ncbi:hypothetical protein [Aestuariimicrobium sp. T2.26MG-19.2B]|uniref:hypothetical protein n=1 Tax=Aestuariimicrobium sp. T2.26MG-19.2B TaxID=3040679 RepID=UPI0024777C4A|nr:hypothetical protein [Aestuariimicrobium sp. T2.26MG-19.2B]CAI9405638.1 hypothetical protein AESSP_01454 [Aestuariimicrobium sp. T2.26MG-19.2B]